MGEEWMYGGDKGRIFLQPSWGSCTARAGLIRSFFFREKKKVGWREIRILQYGGETLTHVARSTAALYIYPRAWHVVAMRIDVVGIGLSSLIE